MRIYFVMLAVAAGLFFIWKLNLESVLYILFTMGFAGDLIMTFKNEKDNKGRIAIDILLSFAALSLVIKSLI